MTKVHQPTEQGQKLIDQFSSHSFQEQQQVLIEYWKENKMEVKAILDGFHFLAQHVIEAREKEDHESFLDFPDEFIHFLIKGVKEERYYFTCTNGREFFDYIQALSPPVFKNNSYIQATLTILLPPRATVNPEFGFPEEYDDSVLEKCREYCEKAAVAYDVAQKHRPTMVNSRKIYEKVKAGAINVSKMDFELAKETYMESRGEYMKHSKIIADGMAYIYQAHKYYPEQLLLLQVYNKYLAKLLATRDTPNPERYILQLAQGPFVYELPSFEANDAELSRGITQEWKEREYRKDMTVILNRLECRYRKRNLMIRLQKGGPKGQILKEFEKVVAKDPDDIQTHILLARFFAELYEKGRNNRVFREKALDHCELAFSKIDFFLDLQGIKKVRERDIQRMGFVKTISGIRLPLVR